MDDRDGDWRCVNGHDLCYGGVSAGPDCPYCEFVPQSDLSMRKRREPLEEDYPDDPSIGLAAQIVGGIIWLLGMAGVAAMVVLLGLEVANLLWRL